MTLPDEAIYLEADPARLTQVFGNLLCNAAKYTEPGGHIWLTAKREGPQIIVTVKDTGIGILAEMLPRIFEMFVQADHSLDRAQGGLGIGLTLVSALVKMHGGTIEARSEGVGKGSEFIVHLPVVVEVNALKPENRAGRKSSAEPAVTPTDRRRQSRYRRKPGDAAATLWPPS